MLKKLLLNLIAWGAGASSRNRWVVTDANDSTIKFRMDAGKPGDITRTHPVTVEPVLVGALGVGGSQAIFGLPVILDAANGARSFGAADTAVTVVLGFTARPFPTQQRSGGDSAALGSGTPPAAGGVVGVLRAGYMSGLLNDITAVIVKGAPVFVWCAADNGVHKQGGLEVLASGGNTAALDPNRYSFNGPCDAKGNVELCVNV